MAFSISSVLLCIFICISSISISPTISHKSEQSIVPNDEIWSIFNNWLAVNPRSYSDQSNSMNPTEILKRFSIFRNNYDYVRAHNEGKRSSYRLGLNKFADLTNDEFKSLYAMGGLMKKFNTTRNDDDEYRYNRNKLPFGLFVDRPIPKSVDWREKGAVASPRDQGSCGSCWAFSTVAAVEGINQIVTGDLVSLSEQELVDCDTESNQGCNGGLMDDAFEFIVENGGLETEAEYPYRASDGVCKSPNPFASKLEVVTIDGFTDVPKNNERALLYAVSKQPVSVAIEASGLDFQLYDRGVFTGKCGTELDHGVTLVGYGSDEEEEGLDYWILRNSWGDAWGEGGYILLERGTRKPEGKCGVNMMASFPVKLGPNPSLNIKDSLLLTLRDNYKMARRLLTGKMDM